MKKKYISKTVRNILIITSIVVFTPIIIVVYKMEQSDAKYIYFLIIMAIEMIISIIYRKYFEVKK